MHQSAMYYASRFFETYCPPSLQSGFTVVEIGSQDVNGSIRDACPVGVNYIGLDFAEGKGVDIVIDDPYNLPIPNESADIVVTTSCFEHSEFFWLVFLEAMRILKPHGVFYLNAPSNGFFHQWPVDCWRFYPDSGHALVSWGKRNGCNTLLLESFTGQRSAGSVSEGGMWNDFVSVILKDANFVENHPNRIIHSLTDFSNGYFYGCSDIVNLCEYGPDFALIEKQTGEIHDLSVKLHKLQQTIAERENTIAEHENTIAEHESTISERKKTITQRESMIAEREGMIAERESTIAAIKNSRSWRITAPLRAMGSVTKRAVAAMRASILTHLIMALLMFPAAIVYYGRSNFINEFLHKTKKDFFRAVIENQNIIRDRLLHRAKWYKYFVFAGFSLAMRIRRSSGVFRSTRNFFRVLQSEGWNGIRTRLVATAPSITLSPRLLVDSENTDDEVAADIAKRILVVDYRTPRSDVSAGERATFGILKDLCAVGYEVVFLPNNMAPSPRYDAELRALGVNVVNRDAGYQYSLHYVAEKGHLFGTFYIFRVDVAETVLSIARQAAPKSRVIFHAPDLYFLRETREAELLKDSAALARAEATRNRELAIMRQVDHIVVVSPAEVPFLRAELPGVDISVFPALYAPVTTQPHGFTERQNIFFLGGFGHPPNINAVQWFAQEVWPIVRAKLPNVEFHIVGAEAPESVTSLGRLAGIKVIGFVPDLDPMMKTMRVGVAPLLYGAGIKGKVAMTMGAGVPCVCTDIAAEGMGIRNGTHSLVENDPLKFAEAVVSLHNDAALWERLSKNGLALVQDKFSDAANRTALLNVLNKARALPISLFCDYCSITEPASAPASDPADDIDVSIIVPVYNKWHLTRACLNSVIQTSAGSGICYEIILADDGSTDETVRAAEIFPGLRVVKTPQNVGFLRNCNNAAEYARGRHILLLNNDTIVLPGWLAALYRTIEDDPSAAIVGSKLLYPDGYIQEAGAALFNNGTALNIGRGSRRHNKVFNISREADYISGASILIRRDFWQAEGGFDERYKNAYCEDSDLAMTARSRGLRVIYQPESEVVHFEHQSYVEQAPSHNSSLQNHNIALLLQKWRDVFRRDHLPVCEWPLASSHAERSIPAADQRRRSTGRMNILYFSPFPSHPASHGNRATINQFARRFQNLGHKVHFVLLQSHEYTHTDVEDMKIAWDSLDVLPYSNPMLAGEHEIPFDGWYEEGLGERIRVLCAKYDIDVVFCSYIFQSKLLEFVPSYMLKIIDTHDKMGDRYEMLRKNGQRLEFFSCTPKEEGVYLRRADIVVARREEEARYFDTVTEKDTATVIPHVEDPQYLEKTFGALRHVGVVASANQINLSNVREFLETIDHHLAGKACPFTVHVAGQVKHMVPSLPAHEAAVFYKEWVCMHGFVNDIRQFYIDMDLIVSPVTMGTGINVKTVQAMAFGMPLLTTVTGCKGIETGDPMHMHTDLEALVASLLALTTSPQELRRLAGVSRERFQSFFDESMQRMKQLFLHPKLFGNPSFFPHAMKCHDEWISDSTLAWRRHRESIYENKIDTNGKGHLHMKCCLCGSANLSFSKEYGWEDATTGKWIINWREHLVCPGCGLNNRMRAIVHLLKEQSNIPSDAAVYITEQASLLYSILKQRLFPALIGSEFLGSACQLGNDVNGIRNEDMTRLTFADNALHGILSFDVLEHIPDYKKALRETFRCLAPGGYFLMTAPFDPDSSQTLIRAEIMENEKIRHILPPEYHGDPINPDHGVLCFQTFGWDLLETMREEGFVDVSALDCWSREYGYLGNCILFTARKP